MEDPFLIPKGNSLRQSLYCLGERRAVKECGGSGHRESCQSPGLEKLGRRAYEPGAQHPQAKLPSFQSPRSGMEGLIWWMPCGALTWGEVGLVHLPGVGVWLALPLTSHLP